MIFMQHNETITCFKVVFSVDFKNLLPQINLPCFTFSTVDSFLHSLSLRHFYPFIFNIVRSQYHKNLQWILTITYIKQGTLDCI